MPGETQESHPGSIPPNTPETTPQLNPRPPLLQRLTTTFKEAMVDTVRRIGKGEARGLDPFSREPPPPSLGRPSDDKSSKS